MTSGLRSILRQDPDVVSVGEMRDNEVSNIAIQAALTGHIVMSTLPTNGAAEPLTRLADMGLAPYLVASALEMVIAQRLLGRNCKNCKEPYELTEDEIEEFRLTPEQVSTGKFFQGMGCNVCMECGNKGRLAAYEILSFNHKLRELIRREGEMSQIIETAKENGMLTLYDAGMEAAQAGYTTLQGVRRVCATSQ